MKKTLLYITFIIITSHFCKAQPWMTSLPIAQDLALVQNKMVLMVWEEATLYPYPVIVENQQGNRILIPNLFTDEVVSPLIWKNFIPVIVNEDRYEDLYLEIKGRRSQNYIEKFNDDSIKIMDVNGNILNVKTVFGDYLNISELIQKYYLDTSRLNTELRNYRKDKNFYSAYYLAEKYLEYAIFAKTELRPELVNLADIYIDEAKEFAITETPEDQNKLKQRADLLEIQQHLILSNPRKVIRQLNRIDNEEIHEVNLSFVAFLYFTAYKILDKEEDAQLWVSKVSLVNLKKSELLVNINK
ncbi:hypothetical protein [Winogradskyella ursingii]|uniref:hypothetical protein n=1 Tax=Winogradskyella ursingii TaxID=2686079 RepID=UPI0015C76551|nr:hypothetical protein [Winogradskyella ursingii]